MDLMKLYDALPAAFPDEAALDLWLRNSYRIPENDFASLGAYRSAIYSQRFLVAPDKENSPRMVKGPKPKPWTPEAQQEYARRREDEARAERDRIVSDQIAQTLEPKRREFQSYLEDAIGERLRATEAELAKLRLAVAVAPAADAAE